MTCFSRGAGRASSTRPRDALGRPLPQGSEGIPGIPDDLELSPLEIVRSGHLGHTQVGERQLEVALVEHLCSYFLAARGSDPVQLVSVPVPRFDAVEGRRGHGTTGRAVDQQAGTAKSLELLECGQESHLVEIDAPVDLVRADLDPGGSDTGAVTRPVVAV
jgi:hypothetical protein